MVVLPLGTSGVNVFCTNAKTLEFKGYRLYKEKMIKKFKKIFRDLTEFVYKANTGYSDSQNNNTQIFLQFQKCLYKGFRRF